MTTIISKFAMDPNISDTQQDESNYLTVSVGMLLRRAEEIAAELGHQWVTIEIIIALLITSGPWAALEPSYLGYHLTRLNRSFMCDKLAERVLNVLVDVVDGARGGVPVRRFSDSVTAALFAAHETRRHSEDMWTSLDHLALHLLASPEAGFLDYTLSMLCASRRELVDHLAADMKPRKDDSWSRICDRLLGKRKTCPHLLSSK
jgi:hypothetical protein